MTIRSWIGFLDTCHTEALIIGHGQVFKKPQGRKPREQDVAFNDRQCLWGLKRRGRSFSGGDVARHGARVGTVRRLRGGDTVIEVHQRRETGGLFVRRQRPWVAGA